MKTFTISLVIGLFIKTVVMAGPHSHKYCTQSLTNETAIGSLEDAIGVYSGEITDNLGLIKSNEEAITTLSDKLDDMPWGMLFLNFSLLIVIIVLAYKVGTLENRVDKLTQK